MQARVRAADKPNHQVQAAFASGCQGEAALMNRAAPDLFTLLNRPVPRPWRIRIEWRPRCKGHLRR